MTLASSDAAYTRRFGGIIRLYGKTAFQHFSQANISIIGLGGVGSWVAEALARSGVGHLQLIDRDSISESNINRQLHSLSSTIGQVKVSVLAKRIVDINPRCCIQTTEKFITTDNLATLIHKDNHYIIDCIDNFRVKAALIAYCKRGKIPIITIGGAGGKTDPSKIRLVDLSRTEQDALLARTRKQLRQCYRFPRNLKRRFSVPAVYSTEIVTQPTDTSQTQHSSNNCSSASHLNCGGLGSATHLTATAGFFAVSHVLKKLAAEATKTIRP